MTSKYHYEEDQTPQNLMTKNGKAKNKGLKGSSKKIRDLEEERDQPSGLSKHNNSRLKEYDRTGFTNNTLETVGQIDPNQATLVYSRKASNEEKDMALRSLKDRNKSTLPEIQNFYQ